MELDSVEKYAIAALFTLALHTIQEEIGQAIRKSNNTSPWGVTNDDHLEALLLGRSQGLKLKKEDLEQYWGLDSVALSGICPRVYLNLGLPIQTWRGLIRLPELQLIEGYEKLNELVIQYAKSLDPTLNIDQQELVSNENQTENYSIMDEHNLNPKVDQIMDTNKGLQITPQQQDNPARALSDIYDDKQFLQDSNNNNKSTPTQLQGTDMQNLKKELPVAQLESLQQDGRDNNLLSLGDRSDSDILTYAPQLAHEQHSDSKEGSRNQNRSPDLLPDALKSSSKLVTNQMNNTDNNIQGTNEQNQSQLLEEEQINSIDQESQQSNVSAQYPVGSLPRQEASLTQQEQIQTFGLYNNQQSLSKDSENERTVSNLIKLAQGKSMQDETQQLQSNKNVPRDMFEVQSQQIQIIKKYSHRKVTKDQASQKVLQALILLMQASIKPVNAEETMRNIQATMQDAKFKNSKQGEVEAINDSQNLSYAPQQPNKFIQSLNQIYQPRKSELPVSQELDSFGNVSPLEIKQSKTSPLSSQEEGIQQLDEGIYPQKTNDSQNATYFQGLIRNVSQKSTQFGTEINQQIQNQIQSYQQKQQQINKDQGGVISIKQNRSQSEKEGLPAGSKAADKSLAPIAILPRKETGLPINVRIYDARVRLAIKRVALWLNIPVKLMASFEIFITKGHFEEKYKTKELAELQRDKQLIKYMTIGAAAVGGGALLALTGGLAAPGIAAGIGSVISLSGGTAVAATITGLGASTAGIASIAGGLGMYGASMSAVRMQRRIGNVKFFAFYNLDLSNHEVDQIVHKKEHQKMDMQQQRLKRIQQQHQQSKQQLYGWSQNLTSWFGGGKQQVQGGAKNMEEIQKEMEEQENSELESMFDVLKEEAKAPLLYNKPIQEDTDMEVGVQENQNQGQQIPQTRQGGVQVQSEKEQKILQGKNQQLEAQQGGEEEKEKQKTYFSSVNYQQLMAGWMKKVEAQPKVKALQLTPLAKDKKVENLSITIAVNGWIQEFEDYITPWQNLSLQASDRVALVWEIKILKALGDAILNFVKSAAAQEAAKYFIVHYIEGSLLASLAWPLAILSAGTFIDSTWDVALNRAQRAGQVLARQLMLGLHGDRPVTLISFSLGARLVYYCLLELAQNNAMGIVEHAVMLGSPIANSGKQWEQIRSVVAGRLVNGYSNTDWVLGYCFRGTKGFLIQAAGLQPVKCNGVENINLTSIISGHTEYLGKMDQVLDLLQINQQ